MRRTHASVAVFAAAALLSGCGEINNTIDKAQACLEAPKVVSDTVAGLAKLVDDPKAMERALDDSSAKLGDLADRATNTTLKEATAGLAAELGKVNVTTANEAVEAFQRVGNETADYLQKVAAACG